MSNSVLGANTSYRSGIVTGENTLLIHGDREKFDGKSPLIFYCHGAGQIALEPQYAYPIYTPIQILAQHGFIIVSSEWNGAENWGAATARTRMSEARTNLTPVAKVDKIGIYGVSMGFMTGVNWWEANPTLTHRVMGVVPVANADNLYDDEASLQAGMDAAYGGDFATNGSPRSPHNLLPTITNGAGKRLRIDYSSADEIIRPADSLALVAPSGVTLERNDLEPATAPYTGHGAFASGAMTDQQSLVAFFNGLKE